MINVLIYYEQENRDTANETIETVNKWVDYLEKNNCKVRGVFIDQSEEYTRLDEIINSSLDKVDILLVGQIQNSFNRSLLLELARSEGIVLISPEQIQDIKPFSNLECRRNGD